MKDCNCKDNMCSCNISEDENQYIIDRLEDIIEISEFLIKALKHRQQKEIILKDLEEKSKKHDMYTQEDAYKRVLDSILETKVNTTKMKYPPYYWGHIWY